MGSRPSFYEALGFAIDERDGEIKIGGTALDSPSAREIVRQERMKRQG